MRPSDQPSQNQPNTTGPTDALAGGGGGGMSSSLAARGLESHRGVNLSQSVRNDLVRSEKQAGARSARHTGRDERATTEQVCVESGWVGRV